MPLDVKICGLRSRDAITEVVRGGARFAGFVFYPPSPRNVSIGEAAELTSRLPGNTIRVGLFVDPTDDQIRSVRRHVFLDWIQLHGDETPDRVAAIKKLTGLPAMKAIKIAAPQDLEAARTYEPVADWLLFDAKVPADQEGALPGGNAKSFDWRILKDARFDKPWMLAGGLNAGNIDTAVAESGAKAVDISSGVEDEPGVKNPAMIAAFLEATANL